MSWKIGVIKEAVYEKIIFYGILRKMPNRLKLSYLLGGDSFLSREGPSLCGLSSMSKALQLT